MFIKSRPSSIPTAYARSIARTLHTILAEMALSSDHDICRLNRISKEDKQKLMSWHPKELYANINTFQDLIKLTTLSKPDSEAICAWDGSMNYTELHAVSSNISRQLIRAGIRVGDLVPFSFQKSLWAVVAILAILKAGAAFVPLDPRHPVARLKDILCATRAKVVVTSESLQQLYSSLGRNAVVVSPQTAYAKLDWRTDNVSLPSVRPQDLAFVLFTSGTTDRPKGIVHEHGPAVSHAVTHGAPMGYNGRVFQFSAYTFDMSVHDILSTLIVGGCICIPSEEDRLNNISQVMNSMKVDYAFLTPSVASLLQPDEITTLKTLACGGEPYRQELIQRWKGKIRLINLYGPAEAGTITLRYLDHEDSTSRTETVGYTLPTQLCILVDPENHDRLVPIGAVGELLVTGTTLARGYFNDEAKNRASFVSNLAWAGEIGLKDRIFYKTGDLLRYNVGSFDGKLDWVKRKDGQIKYHGQRMEAGEIEHHLNGLPMVATSAVVLPQQGCFSGQLVAVLQMSSSVSPRISKEPLRIDSSQALSIETVKKHLSKTLPSYMIPAECVVIRSMPFTPSCKIDRNSLRGWLESLVSRPDGAAATAVSIEASPLAEVEKTAHAISAIVTEMVASRDTNQALRFQGRDFCLQSSGIDSIQIMSLSIFVQKTFGARIPLGVLFSSATTIRHVAAMIDRKIWLPDNATNAIDLHTEVEIHTSELFEGIKTQTSLNGESGGPATFRNVFLTGASGYLGSEILRDLLQRPEIEIYALTRSPSIAEGFDQIQRRARSSAWWQEGYASRVHVWQGDLTVRNLGLSRDHLERLCGDSEKHLCIDTVIHNGAKVHYNLDYQTLKASNLHPTKELLAITSGASNISTFIYISGGTQPCAWKISNSMHTFQAGHTNGYGQSKFVAESLVRNCMVHPAFEAKCLRIIRPGYIIGPRRNGIANQTDFIWRLIAGCVEIGAYNEDEESHWLFISDVERVSEIVTDVFTPSNTPPSSATDQVLEGILFSSLWTLLKETFGYALKPLGQALWLQSLKTAVLMKGESHLLFPLLHSLETSAGQIGSKVAPENSIKSCVRVKDAVCANVRYLIKVGFLQPPRQNSAALSDLSMAGIDESGKTAAYGSDSSTTSSEERSLVSSLSVDNLSLMTTTSNDDDESYGVRKASPYSPMNRIPSFFDSFNLEQRMACQL